MKQANVLQKAVLSEKAYRLMEKGVYTFFVASNASKNNIKDSVEKMFSVNVEKVNVSKAGAKQKKIAKTRKTVLVGGGKKAIVYLAAGHTIAVLFRKTGAIVEKAKTAKAEGPERSRREKDIQIESAEGKEG